MKNLKWFQDYRVVFFTYFAQNIGEILGLNTWTVAEIFQSQSSCVTFPDSAFNRTYTRGHVCFKQLLRHLYRCESCHICRLGCSVGRRRLVKIKRLIKSLDSSIHYVELALI